MLNEQIEDKPSAGSVQPEPVMPVGNRPSPAPETITISDSSDNQMVAEQTLHYEQPKELSVEEIQVIQVPLKAQQLQPAPLNAVKEEKKEQQPAQLLPPLYLAPQAKTPSTRPANKEPCIREIKALNSQLIVSKELKRGECNVTAQRTDNVNLVEEFIPEELVVLDHVKIRDSVLVGERYQAQIKPQQSAKYTIPNPSSQLIWRSSTGFVDATFQQFRELFGERRTTQQLCHLVAKCGNNWQLMPQVMMHYRRDLKKLYNDADSRL